MLFYFNKLKFNIYVNFNLDISNKIHVLIFLCEFIYYIYNNNIYIYIV